MPELDGFEVCRRLRGEAARDLPIIMLTTRGEDRNREIGRSSGATENLTKPLTAESLRKLEAYLGD